MHSPIGKLRINKSPSAVSLKERPDKLITAPSFLTRSERQIASAKGGLRVIKTQDNENLTPTKSAIRIQNSELDTTLQTRKNLSGNFLHRSSTVGSSIFTKTLDTLISIKKESDNNSAFQNLLNSKVGDQKGLLQRSLKLSELRKKSDVTKIKSKPITRSTVGSPKLGSDKTLTRFVDQLILSGTLPLEAVDYFSPETTHNKQDSVKNSPQKRFVSKGLLTSTRISQNKDQSPRHNVQDVIPEWMQSLTRFNQLAGTRRKHSQNPIYKILCRNPNERDLSQLNLIAKWLSEMSLFSNFPFDRIVEIGKTLEPIFVDKGDDLCTVGDPADCCYIIFEGQIDVYANPFEGERCVGQAGPNDILGRNALDYPGKRTATLKASKPTYVAALSASQYQYILGEIKNTTVNNNNLIYDFVVTHNFLKTFAEVKKHAFASNLALRKFVKNDVVYDIDTISDKLYVVMSGKVVRRMPVTIDKSNKWPTGQSDWRICKILKTYSVTLPIEKGEIFGVSEMIAVTKRKEQVLVDEDAEILILSREMFYQIFDEDDVFKFQKKVQQEDKKKSEKIRRMFEQQEKLQKVKSMAMSDALNFNLNNKTYYSFREISEKVAEWKKFEKGMTNLKTADKVVVSVQEVLDKIY